jgi:uroporphyrinogen III methyltransferase/synthase
VAFASANAVDRFMGLLRDGRDLGDTKLAAVGQATAAALARHHLVADVVASPATAESLADAIPAPPPVGDGGRGVLLPRAAAGRRVLGARLRSKGFEVTEVHAYRTVPISGDEPGVAAAVDAVLGADVVTFTSPSAVRSLLRLAGGRPLPPTVACIGPLTATAARRCGLTVDVVAEEHSAGGIVEALVAHGAARDRRPAT